MDLEALRHGNFAELGEAVTDWEGMVTKLETLARDARDNLKSKSDKAEWAGMNAQVTRSFVDRTAGEFEDAHTQASSIAKILKDTREELISYRGQIQDADARWLKKNLVATDTGDGGFTVTMNIHPDRAGRGTDVPGHTPEDSEACRREFNRILSKATHSDDSAAKALRLIVDQQEQGFSDADYNDRDAAARAVKEAEDVAALVKKEGDEMSPEEFDRLNSTLARYKNDPLFQEQFARSLGPKGTLDFWADLSDASDATGLQRERRDQLDDLQRNLGVTLAGATQSDTPAMQRWQTDMIDLGDKTVQTRGSNVYGFQLMSNLMRTGDYDDGFLKNYGDALIATEKKMKLPDHFWSGTAGTMPSKMNFLGGEDGEFGKDPMTGFMHALSRSPEASTDFFNTTKPHDNAEWALTERTFIDDTPFDDDDANHGRNATGRALSAAATGVSGLEDGKLPQSEPTAEQREVMKKSLHILAGAGDDFPPEMRDSMAYVLGVHGDEVHQAMSSPVKERDLDSGELMEVSKQISRNRGDYQILNEVMHQAITADILTEKGHPEDSLDRAGRTIGFLEEARYQATNTDKGEALSDASWDKNWRYHAVGGFVNATLGPFGDVAQRGVDVVTVKMLEDDQARINADATADHTKTYRNRQGELEALADLWYQENSAWAEDPRHEGYSKGYGVYDQIAEAANDGNQKAEGVSGDQ